MRSLGKLALALSGAFLFVTLVGGQQPGGGGKFGGGFGGGGGGNDPLALLRNESVKKELGLTEEQTAKLPDAVRKALADVLDAKQQKRLREIELQQKGTNALADASVQKDLKLSEDQTKNIKTIIEDSRKARAEMFKDLKGGDFAGMREKMQAMQKETNEKLNEVLTAEQRRSWKQMQGEEFKLVTPGGGGFKDAPKKDGGFKKGKKKTDDL